MRERLCPCPWENGKEDSSGHDLMIQLWCIPPKELETPDIILGCYRGLDTLCKKFLVSVAPKKNVNMYQTPQGNQGAHQGTKCTSLLQCGHRHKVLNPETAGQQGLLKKLTDIANNMFPMSVADCIRIYDLNCSKEGVLQDLSDGKATRIAEQIIREPLSVEDIKKRSDKLQQRHRADPALHLSAFVDPFQP
ncbi:hypothetical protein llap_8357 [Limosa lapponica baueri]|uniref:Uncharacterized protein n=1 Tax=Limosa lapponica baueri TaxID=1758121 RepID=A0A2I0U5Q2_LIMLA|nr:hypothetical protein llap_8357 [Limosa lapponica baueri]